jgi:hypothetical protein
MADGDWSGEIFSLDGKLRPAAADVRGRVAIPEGVAPTDDPYSPYGAAWKEFDELQKLAKNSGPFAWAHWAWGIFLPLLGLLDQRRVPKKDSLGFFLVFLAAGAFQMIRSQHAKNLILHWPCPRCHAEWPGNKTEKDSRCAVCGLKLHQMWT